MGKEISKFRNLIKEPAKINPVQLVDSLVKEGMGDAYQKIMYIKENFKKDPKQFDHSEINLKLLYRE